MRIKMDELIAKTVTEGGTCPKGFSITLHYTLITEEGFEKKQVISAYKSLSYFEDPSKEDYIGVLELIIKQLKGLNV